VPVTESVKARHRAPVRPATPLSSLTTAATGQLGTIGRGGVVLAMSSGLVATLGLPAQAISSAKASGADAGPRTVSQPALAFQGALISAPTAMDTAAPLTAPVTATVTFDKSAFSAVPAPPPAMHPNAAPPRHSVGGGSSSVVAAPAPGSSKGSSVLGLAARYVGVPYVYGGTSPAGWDCSGAMQYIFALMGVDLPRTADEQLNATTRISRSAAMPGDLVFFLSGGSAYHVGIYAGGNMMYDAGRSGRSFTKRAIFSSAVVFGRI
jgi:cell wall-associated NlpC family hydrolase